jgi:hypothetical protein
MMRKKQGLWEEEDKSEVYSAHVFHNNIYEIAKVRVWPTQGGGAWPFTYITLWTPW